MTPHTYAEYEAAKMLLELSKDNKQSLIEMKSLLEKKERQVISLCRSAIADLKTGSLYVDNSGQSLSASPALATHHNSIFDTDMSVSSIVNRRSHEQNFNNVGSSDHVLTNDIDNGVFVSGKPLPKNKTNLNSDRNIGIDNIKEKQEILKEVYLKVTNLLSRAVVNGESLKDKLEEANLIPIKKTNKENIPQEVVRTNNDFGKKIQANAMTTSDKATYKENLSDEYSNDTAEKDNYKNVSIGSGYTTIPANRWYTINWNSYTIATRTLLCAVFPREILATHSLTGKSSPAFSNKPPKQRLNPKIISDIVETVSMRCKVPRSLVRTAITIKCADEAKSQRIRMGKLEQSRRSNNRDNNSPMNS